MALHICYTATEEFPDSIAIQEAMDQAWRAVAVRDQRAGQPGSRVEVGDLLNAASDFAQWQLSAAIHQSTLSNGDKTNSEAHLHLRQAILNGLWAVLSCRSAIARIQMRFSTTLTCKRCLAGIR